MWFFRFTSFPLAVSWPTNVLLYSNIQQYFTNISALQNIAVLKQIHSTKSSGALYITEMSKYHNAGIWGVDKKMVPFMFN